MLNGFLTTLPDDFYSVKSDKLAEELTGTTLPLIIDVRSAEEWNKDGYIEGAINIPFSDFFASLDKLPAERCSTLSCTVRSGHRGSIVMMALRLMGYTDVVIWPVVLAHGKLPAPRRRLGGLGNCLE